MQFQEPIEVHVEYPEGPISDPGNCRAAAVAMHRAAFAGLGWPDPKAEAAKKGGGDSLVRYGVAAGVAIGVIGCVAFFIRARK